MDLLLPLMQKRSRGFSLLELVIVVCIVAALAALAADRIMGMRMQAERTNMNTLLGNLRSALSIKVAEAGAKGQTANIARLAGSNPMEQLTELPESYRGEFFGIDPGLFQGGEWYFDRRDKTLVYRVQFEDYFESPLPGPARARFTVRLSFEDKDRNGRFDAGTDLPTGVSLVPAESYRWLEQSR